MKNVKQDDAVERMLNRLEGLVKRQNDSAGVSRHVDTPLTAARSNSRGTTTHRNPRRIVCTSEL